MRVEFPQIICLASAGHFMNRKGRAVFLKKHGLGVNLKVVKDETKEISDSKIQDWLFLVEGYRKYRSLENLYLDDFTCDLGIATKDPIEPPFTTNVAQAASIEKLFAALSILLMDYLDFMADNAIEQMEDKQLEAFFDLNVNAVAKAFEVSPKRLRKEFDKLKWSNEHLLSEQILNLSKKRRELIDESNSQSKIKLVGILSENAQPNLFIMSGIEHAGVFT